MFLLFAFNIINPFFIPDWANRPLFFIDSTKSPPVILYLYLNVSEIGVNVAPRILKSFALIIPVLPERFFNSTMILCFLLSRIKPISTLSPGL